MFSCNKQKCSISILNQTTVLFSTRTCYTCQTSEIPFETQVFQLQSGIQDRWETNVQQPFVDTSIVLARIFTNRFLPACMISSYEARYETPRFFGPLVWKRGPMLPDHYTPGAGYRFECVEIPNGLDEVRVSYVLTMTGSERIHTVMEELRRTSHQARIHSS